MNKIFSARLVLAFSLFLLYWWIPVFAQKGLSGPQRLDPKAGGPAVTVKGEIKDRVEVVYVFSAKAGQKFSGRITRQSGDASFSVTDPEGEALPEEEFEVNTTLNGSLKKTGDYRIAVNTVNTPSSKYTLSVRVH